EPRPGPGGPCSLVPPRGVGRSAAVGPHAVGGAAATLPGGRGHRALDAADLERSGGSRGRRAIPPRAGLAARPGSRGAVVARRVGIVLAVVLPPAAAPRLRGATPLARLVPPAALPCRSPHTTLRRGAGR